MMLALRARGLGTSWTTLHLLYEKEVAELLGIPDNITQVAAEVQESRRGSEYAPVDNPYQLPAEFVINQNGIISLAYRSQYCADFANPDVLIASIKEAIMEVS
jgi:nitroreductase